LSGPGETAEGVTDPNTTSFSPPGIQPWWDQYEGRQEDKHLARKSVSDRGCGGVDFWGATARHSAMGIESNGWIISRQFAKE